MKSQALFSILVLVMLLLSSIAYAEPDPEYGKLVDWFKLPSGVRALSIGSTYESFVRWNPNLDTCYYYTGIYNSISMRAVADSYCSYRTYTKEVKTIASIDKELAASSKPATPTTPGGSTSKGIGEACMVASECGGACKGYPSGYSPRCIDGGKGRVCFCGQDEGVYSTVCARDNDCESGEKCYAGICTIPQYETGNPAPVTQQEICQTADCNTKCSDGTPVFTCSKTLPKYCFKEGNKGVLKDYSGVCGCPTGQRLDFGGLTCCDPAKNTCFNCLEGEIKTKACPDGTEIIAVSCNAGNWQPTNAVCQIKEGEDRGFIQEHFAVILAVIGVLLLIAGYFIVRSKK